MRAPPTPQPRPRHAEGRTSAQLVPETLQGRGFVRAEESHTYGHRGRWPRSHGDAGSPARWPGSQPWTPAAGTTRAQRGPVAGGKGLVTGAPALPTQPHTSLWPLTWPPGPPRPFNSSKNCILSTTRGSMRGGYGRPVTITPRPFMSAKSRPSLAWGAVGTLFLRLPMPRPSEAQASTYGWGEGNFPPLAQRYVGFTALRASHIHKTPAVLPTGSPRGCSRPVPRPTVCRMTAQRGTVGLRPPDACLLDLRGSDWPIPPCRSPRVTSCELRPNTVHQTGAGECGTQTLGSLTFPRHTARKTAPLDPGEAARV